MKLNVLAAALVVTAFGADCATRKTNCDNPARTADNEKAASHDAAFSYAQRPSD